jgi:hypothetical protein
MDVMTGSAASAHGWLCGSSWNGSAGNRTARPARGYHRRTIPVRAIREKDDELPVLLAEFFGRSREYLRREVVFTHPIDVYLAKP